MAASKDFYQFLLDAELQHYYNSFNNDLKVTGVSQLKYVDEDDLVALGMTRPEMRRLKKHYHKECPRGAFGKIKKRMSLRSTQAQKPVVSVDARPIKNSKHIIPLDSIALCKALGTGEFGTVQQGVWTNEDGERIQVAIKCLQRERIEEMSDSESSGADKYQDFLREVTTMHTLDHENIVHMYGVVFDKECMMLVSELAPLRSLLECLKEPNLKWTFTVPVLCDFAVQIASGMAYLESKRLIHRDLAARNCLVFNKDRVKISDFGLSRALGMGKDYYQTNFSASLKLPVAWCAPECINYLRFTTASDVWAFGVTLWEIFSYGFQPWAAMTGQQILEAIDEPSCQRLERPDHCPSEYYDLMLRCWRHEEKDRPPFSELVNSLRQCKPEDVRAVEDCPTNARKDFLDYKAQDIITVLDKRPAGYPDMYLGCMTNGRTGPFNPADVVPHTEFKHLQSPQYRRTKINKKESARKSQSLNRNRISAAMISAPQSDLRHTGHVGYDGFMFGDVSFIGDQYDKLPIKVGPKSYLNGSAASLLSTELSDAGTPDPVRPSHIGLTGKAASNGHDAGFLDSMTDTDSCISVSTLDAEKYESLDDDLGSFKMPDMSPGFGLDFGSSLMDEIFKSLSSDDPAAEKAENTNDKSDDEPTTPTRETATTKESRLKKFKHKLDIRRDPDVDLTIPVKPMSASEEREINSAIQMANEIAKMNTCDTMLSSSPKQASDNECESPKTKLSLRMPFTKARSPRPQAPERPSFSEEMGKIEAKDVDLDEGVDVYDALITNRKPRQQRVNQRKGDGNRLSADSSDAASTSSGEGSRLNRTSSSDRNSRLSGSEISSYEGVVISSVMTSSSSLSRPKEAPPAPPPAVPPKPRVSPFSTEGKSFISSPLESAVDRNKIGTVELKSIERIQTVSRVHIPENRVQFADNVTESERSSSEVAATFGLKRVELPDKSATKQSESDNPLRILRSGPQVFRPQSRPGNSRKLSVDEQTQNFPSSRRKFSADGTRREEIQRENPFRSMVQHRGGEEDSSGHPPVPPRDVSRPGLLNVKPRQRKHPLLIGETGYSGTKVGRGPASPTDAPEAHNAEQLGFFDELDPFWNEEVHFDTGDPSSYDDQRSGQCSEVRQMQRVLKDCGTEDCLEALEQCCYNVPNSIKFVKLRQLLSLGLADVNHSKHALVKAGWSVVDAADYLIENPLQSPECVDV